MARWLAPPLNDRRAWRAACRFASATPLGFAGTSFRGDPRTYFFAVDRGALAAYEPRWNGHGAIIDFAFPGDFVGLGFLPTHTCNARATVETRVQCLPLTARALLLSVDVVRGGFCVRGPGAWRAAGGSTTAAHSPPIQLTATSQTAAWPRVTTGCHTPRSVQPGAHRFACAFLWVSGGLVTILVLIKRRTILTWHACAIGPRLGL